MCAFFDNTRSFEASKKLQWFNKVHFLDVAIILHNNENVKHILQLSDIKASFVEGVIKVYILEQH